MKEMEAICKSVRLRPQFAAGLDETQDCGETAAHYLINQLVDRNNFLSFRLPL